MRQEIKSCLYVFYKKYIISSCRECISRGRKTEIFSFTEGKMNVNNQKEPEHSVPALPVSKSLGD